MAPAGVVVVEIPLRPLWRFLVSAIWQSVATARRWQADIVVAGSGLAALPAWVAARVVGARSLAYVHGLDIVVRHWAYRLAWLPALRRMDRIIANSSPTAALARRAGVVAERIALLHPGVTTPEHRIETAPKSAPREEFRLGPGPVLLSVGRLTSRKGIKEFVRDVLPGIVAVHPEATLLVAGDAPKDSLHAEQQSPESIRIEAERAGVAARLTLLGKITDEELERAMSVADVHVFPVRELAGDPEGFGMVAVEAAAHGLATAAYASGGVVDSVAVGISGLLAPPGDAAAMIRNILELIEHPLPQAPMQAFAAEFAWPRFGERLRAMLVHELDPERQEP